MNEAKKMMVWLVGISGVAVIVVLTTLALKFILAPNVPAPVAIAQPTVVVAPTPVAEVVSVKPHYISVSIPKHYCTNVQHTVVTSEESQTPGAGAVLGGVTGGLLGSQIGGGNGRLVTSAAGAVIGAFTGNSMQNSMNSPQVHTVYSTSCKTHYIQSSVQKGYEVAYTYNGTQGVVMMDNAPMIGSALPIPLH